MSSERMAVGLLFIAIAVLAIDRACEERYVVVDSRRPGYLANQQVPVTDTYSHTIRGRPWPNHEWLTDVLFYGAHRLGGCPDSRHCAWP